MEPKMVHASFANKNPFKGPPSDELDHAWHQLFINSNVRVTADDLAKINKTSVPVTDDKGGYYAIPGKIGDSEVLTVADWEWFNRCLSSASLPGKHCGPVSIFSILTIFRNSSGRLFIKTTTVLRSQLPRFTSVCPNSGFQLTCKTNRQQTTV
jgi:hypothetical protein